MPQLTQAQKEFALRESGYDPASYDIDDNWYVTPKATAATQPAVLANGLPQPKLTPAGPAPMGVGGTFVKEAIHAAPAAAAGGLGAWGGGLIGSAIAPGPGTVIGAILGGLGAGMGTSIAQDAIEEAVVPDYVAQRQANLAANPVTGMTARLATMPLGGMNFSAANLGRAGGDALSRVTGATSRLNPAQTANLANVGIGAGLGTGIGVGTQLAQGRPLGETLTSLDTLEALIGGAAFNKPNAIGKRYGWQDIPASAPRITDDPRIAAIQAELARNKQAASKVTPTPEQQAMIDLAGKGLYEKKEGKAASLDRTDILTANQAAEQRGINPNKAAELEAQRVKEAGLLTPEDIYQQKVRKELERAAAARRKADFEKATLELQQQAAQAQAETAQAQAAKQELKQRQQLQMKLGVQATPEAIAARGITMAPENRPATPRGNNKRVARMQEEMVDPLQDEADAIQERLERKNQDPEDSLIDTELRREAIEAKAGTPLGDFAKTLFDARAKEMGADVGTTTEKGSFALLSEKLKRMAASIGTAEGADTRAHEVIGHIYNKMLELSPYESDKRIQRQMLKAAAESPELKAINERRVAAGKKAWPAEEFVANQQGLEWLVRNAKKESPNRAWFEQWKAGMKSVMGNANAADLRRLVDYKWHNDAPFNEYFGIKTAGDAAASAGARVNQPADEGFNSKDGDDILSSNEDIEVIDALPTKLPAPPEGYRRVKVVKPDGGSYETFFNDKYYDMGEMGKFASVANMLPDGKLSHTVTKKGEVIEEIPDQLYRRDQPEGEALPTRKRTKEEHVAQQIERNRLARAQQAALRHAAGDVLPPEQVATNMKGDLGEMLNKTGRPPSEGNVSKRNLISLNKETDNGGQLGDTIADLNAVIPGESIGDVSLQDLPNAPKSAKPAKETLEERIARKADEQLAKMSSKFDVASDTDIAAAPKRVAPEEIVHTAELDQNYADMYDITAKGLEDLADKRADLVAEHGEDSDAVASIDTRIEKQKKMLEWISKQDPTARVDLKGIKKVYQPEGESLPAENIKDKSLAELTEIATKRHTQLQQKLAERFNQEMVAERRHQKKISANYDAIRQDTPPMFRDKHWLDLGRWYDNKGEGYTRRLNDTSTATHEALHAFNLDNKPIINELAQQLRQADYHYLGYAFNEIGYFGLAKIARKYGDELADAIERGKQKPPYITIEGETFSPWHIVNEFFTQYAEGQLHKDISAKSFIQHFFGKEYERQLNRIASSSQYGKAKWDGDTNRYYQPADEALPATIYERTGAVGKGLLHTIGAEVDKLKAISPAAGKGAEDFLTYLRARRGELEGSFNYDLRQVRKAQNVKEYWFQDNEDYQKVVQWRDAMQDGDGEPFALTPTQQAINEVISKNLKASLDLRESFKKEGDIDGLARGTAGKPHYLPHVMARDVATTLAEQPTSAKAAELLRDFIAYRQEKAGQTEEQARADWKTIRNSFNMVEEGNIASRFGAIDKALGKGLPKSMREQNLMDRMGRFNRRFARRVAFHEAIQRNPEAREAFFNSESGAASTTVGKNILRDMFGIREHTEATRSAISGVVRALMLGPLTGAKDVVSGQVLGLQHMGLEQVLPAKMEALAKYGENYKKAIETGVVRNGYGGLESGEGGLRNVQAIMERSRDVINQVQGRQMLETVSRVLNYGEGKFLAADAFRAIEQGRLTAQKRGFLDDFVPDWQQYKNKPVPQKVLDEAAARFVESVQGTYDYRGLPAIAMQGTFSPFLSLARWNVEKFNNFTKKVVDPATKGNYQPLLMATLGAFIGGTAVNALVEEVSGRKERTAKWSEIAASKEQTGLIGYKLAALASMAGYAGILGDVIKSGFDAKYKNRVQTFSNPLIDAGATIVEDTKFLVQAMEDGDLPAVTDVLHLLATDYIQAYRIALPHVSDEKKKELEATNKRRDLKVWKMGEGEELSAASTMRPNPLLGKTARQFKQTDDVNEAAALVPELVDKAIEKATIDGSINPEILKAELSKYKRNSYQTVPNPQESPMAASRYIDFLSKTQSTNEASRRIEDYMRRNTINRAKSSMIPTIQ